MIGRSVARRYLQAAMEAAEQAGVREELGAQLQRLRAAMEQTPDLRRLLRHPTVGIERKLDAIADVLEEQPAGPLSKLIALLIDNDRVDVLSVADEVYQQLVDEADGVLRAFVTTPMPMSDEHSQRLAAALSRWLDEDVVIDPSVDPEALGGIVVRVGDRVLDGSLRGRLERIRQVMTQ